MDTGDLPGEEKKLPEKTCSKRIVEAKDTEPQEAHPSLIHETAVFWDTAFVEIPQCGTSQPATVTPEASASGNTDATVGVSSARLKSIVASFNLPSKSTTVELSEEIDCPVANPFSSSGQKEIPSLLGVDTARSSHDPGTGQGSSSSRGINISPKASPVLFSDRVPVQDVTFQSSFLQHSIRTKDRPDTNTGLGSQAGEQDLTLMCERSVRHLEVAFNDADLGNISVRAEMKDGMLHASVLSGRSDVLVTASALHSFLELSKVAIHSVRVESTSAQSAAKSVGVLSKPEGSSTDERSERNQGQESRHVPFAHAISKKRGENILDWSRSTRTGRVPVTVPYRDGRNLSIHI